MHREKRVKMGSGEKSRTHTLPSAAFSNSALVPKLQAPLGFFPGLAIN